MAMRVGRSRIQLAAFDGPHPKTSYKCKNLADKPISYTSRVIDHIVPNFVAVAMRVD